MEGFLEPKAGTLSFRQQQRVAIIRALCQPFEFLLADECFSHMDTSNTRKAYDVIREECKKQEAGLLLTALHSMKEADIDQRFLL
jgi:ABC-type phosphate/phosphonate transport system ATPase subunit